MREDAQLAPEYAAQTAANIGCLLGNGSHTILERAGGVCAGDTF